MCCGIHILELDGFNAPTVVNLLTPRFHNFVQLNQPGAGAAELLSGDFMDMIYRGWGYVDLEKPADYSMVLLQLVPKVSGYC